MVTLPRAHDLIGAADVFADQADAEQRHAHQKKQHAKQRKQTLGRRVVEERPADRQHEHKEPAAHATRHREHREILQRRDREARDQVEVEPDQAVERVVRHARMPLLVLHPDLRRIAGKTVGQRGNERVDRPAPHDRVDDRPAVRAQHAALVRHLDARGFFPHEIDQPRGILAEKRVLPVEPVSAHVVEARVDFLQQLRNFLGRILQVGVERHDHVAAHAFERRHDRHVLAVVAVEIDHARHVRPRRVLRLQESKRTVRTAVVGENDFVAAPECIEHRIQAREQRRQVQLLVVDRDDDRNGNSRRGAHGVRWGVRIAVSVSTTRSASARVMVGKSGSVRMLRHVASASGKSPSFHPSRR